MKHGIFWHFARRMLKRRKLAIGAIVFSIVSAGGLASGLIAIGPLLKVLMSGEASVNLHSIMVERTRVGCRLCARCTGGRASN